MLIYRIILLSIYYSWVCAFTFHDDLIPMTFGGETLDKPFLGGFNRPKIQWLDWDADGDIDLFILDAGGYLRYLENQGTASAPDFHLITTAYQNIFCGGWFYFADFDFDGQTDLMAQNGDNPDNVSYFKNLGGSLYFINILSSTNSENVSSSSVMTPTFADIDNDGLHDLNNEIRKSSSLFSMLKQRDTGNKDFTLEVYDGIDAIKRSYEILFDIV